MKNRKNPPAARTRKTGRMRLIVFSLLFVFCTVALGLSGVKPFDRFRASAQQQRDQTLVDKPAVKDAQVGEELSESVRQQISALMQEKANRTKGQRKMDSRLIYAMKMDRGERLAVGVDTLDVGLDIDAQGKVIIDITAEVDASLLSKLKIAGAKIITSVPQYRTVRVEVSLDAVETIANFPEVIFLRPKEEAMFWQEPPVKGAEPTLDPDHLRMSRPPFEERERKIRKQLLQALNDFQFDSYTSANGGVRKSEADKTHKAELTRNTYGFNGEGIKIGVLSNGVRNLAAAQASGDLGPVTVLPGQSGTAAGQCATNVSCDEGTAMLELIHDLAPGAQLFYATALPTSANFAQNIRNLRTAGCDIIVDDVFYFAESPFQDGQAPSVISPTNGGVIAQAVNDVTAAGALYFSSAGNSGNKNDNTSGVWEGDFVDGGDAPAPIGAVNGRIHQFPVQGAIPAQNFNSVTTSGGPLILNWSDPLGGSNNDYDLYVLNSTGSTVLAASTSGQDGNDDPLELVNATLGTNLRIVIVKFSGASRFLHVSLSRGRIAVNTPGITSGHSSGADAFGVAATPAIGPFPNPFNSTNVVETFSSDGLRKLFFQGDGTPFTPGDLLATGGIIRQKPDITAADGASVTGAGGFGIQFFGTSAAAPHAAAIAGLLKSAIPGLTPAQVRTALTTTAIDIEAAGVDRDSGVGIVMADTSMASIGSVAGAANLSLGTVTVTDVGGNVNGYIEPGERATLDIPLLNTGINPATSVTATLSSTTAGVVITPSATRGYPDIPATSGTSTNATPFEFVLQEGATYGTNIDFVLTVNYNGTTRTYPFTIPTGQLAYISTTLDTTAPVVPGGANYTAATGTQTGRLNFTFPISACGSTKTNPGPTSALARRYDAYTFTNTSLAPICATVLLTHSANALLHAVAYQPAFVPATPAVNYAGDGGGSTTQGAGTTQLFSFTVPASTSFTVVVSESNQNGGLNVPYNLRVTGLPGGAVPANQPPVNNVPGAQITNEDTSLVFTGPTAISTSDPDAGNNPVQVTLTATNGTFSLGGTSGLTFTPAGPGNDGANDTQMIFTGSISDINAALNNLTFAPTPDYNGAASLAIQTNDQGFTGTGGAQSDSDTVPITVNAVNDLPSFTKGPDQTVPEDSGSQSVPNWATNISPGPPNESGQMVDFIVSNNNNTLFSVQPAVAANGTLTYTPAPDANGGATVTVKIHDNGGGTDTSASQQFVITVTEVNDAPTAVSDTLSNLAEDSGPQAIPFATLTANDSKGPANESGQTLIVKTVSNPVGGTVSIVGGNVLFTPTANYNGPASFDYTVEDNGTTNGSPDPRTSGSATASFTITEVNDTPTAVNDAISNVAEDSGQRVIPFATLTANDSKGPANESGQTLIVKTVSNPVGGTVSISGGNVLFTPTADYNGPASFDYTVEDNGTTNGAADPKTSGTATASFIITEVNDAPTAVNDTLSNVTEDSGQRIISFATLTGNDSKGPANESGQTLIVKTVGNPVGGTVSISGGNVLFTPTANYAGPASFDYTVEDNGTTNGAPDPRTSGVATASFTITAINDAPVAVNDTLTSMAEDAAPRAIPFADLTGNDSKGGPDESGQTLTVVSVGNAVGGSVALVPGFVVFTPNGNYNGPASFTYTVQDNGTTNGLPDPKTSESALVQFTITEVNDAPTAVNDTLPDVAQNSGERTIAFAVLTANDVKGPADESGQTLTVKTVSNPVGVTVSIVAGTVRVTPLPGFSGAASFQYTVQDNGTTSGFGDEKVSAPATVSFNVTAPAGGVLRFSAANYSVAEGAGFRTITVERSGDTSQAVTVDYASSDHSNPADFIPCSSPGVGFASSRCDFTTALGTLRFAAGETSKTFNVLISNDNYVEGPETLELTLSNPTGGAVFGVPQTAILTINDDLSEPGTNPIDTSSEFVRSQYHDFLNREPDAPGLAFWTDNIELCNDASRRPVGQTVAQCIDKQRESTAVAFFAAPEFQITGGFVYNLYKGSLTGAPNYDGGSPGRFPTSLEFMRDVGQVSEGIVVNNAISGAVVEANRNRLAAEFVQRPEFIAKYGGLNNTLYVDELFNTTGIVATPAQKQTLVDGLTGGTETRASVLRKVVDGTVVISESNVQFTTSYGQAFINQENRRKFVFMEYIAYLRRNPDQAGFVFWLGKLNFYGGDPFQAEMVRSFILSPEYRQRFGQ